MARNEFSNMTPEERRENGRKGGIASGEAKRAKKAMRERLEILLELPMKAGKSADIETIKNFAALKGKNITVQDAMMIAQIQKALKGDTNAAAFVRDTAGFRPVEKTDADLEEQLARIEKIKAETARIKGDSSDDDKADDGFLEALQSEAESVWQDQ